MSLLVKYRRVRSKSLKLQDALSVYIIKNDALKNAIADDVTYGAYLRQLQKNHMLNLSEKKYTKLKSSNNRILLSATSRTLNEQEVYLENVEKELSDILGA